ncbi:MAG: gamma-glutamyl-gamma-aminobutyrate hydrolase family protein [Verrucomicrobiota bacterium]|nr:gamma-glutamyl-gamma-aminobutyrate hydrolase family protein [Verrucomicrobiota bacterium]
MNIATWVRECDTEYFSQWTHPYEELAVFNGRENRSIDPEEMHGLLLTGGPDISAEFLKQEISDPTLIRNAVIERDRWEFSVLPHFIEKGKPILAICKGFQLLNVELGGTLHLDIPNHDAPELKTANVQPLRHSKQARYRFPKVNSSHHQALDKVADSLTVESWSSRDDIIEAARMKKHPFCVGVQYHPERDNILYAPLFHDFFLEVRKVGG